MSYIVYYLHLFTSCHGFFTAVIIGFEMEEYTVFESNGVVTLVGITAPRMVCIIEVTIP